MSMAITLEWVKDLQYIARDDSGHSIVVESQLEQTPSGFSPSQLLLVAAAGCMANHVMTILQKKRMNPVKLQVWADGERVADHPRRYKSINLTFEIYGDVPQEVADGVVQLAKAKYCSVLNSLDPTIVVNIKSKVITL
jgi:putative redox protein